MIVRDELYVVNLANQLINKFKIDPKSVCYTEIPGPNLGGSRVFEVNIRLNGNLKKIEQFVNNVSYGTLGKIVGSAISNCKDSSHYRSTLFQDVCADAYIFPRRWDGLFVLRIIAVYVIVAAMYDILATQWWIGNVEEGTVEANQVRVGFAPKQDMLIYVRNVRLHDLLA